MLLYIEKISIYWHIQMRPINKCVGNFAELLNVVTRGKQDSLRTATVTSALACRNRRLLQHTQTSLQWNRHLLFPRRWGLESFRNPQDYTMRNGGSLTTPVDGGRGFHRNVGIWFIINMVNRSRYNLSFLLLFPVDWQQCNYCCDKLPKCKQESVVGAPDRL
jgi:hypothetical protein